MNMPWGGNNNNMPWANNRGGYAPQVRNQPRVNMPAQGSGRAIPRGNMGNRPNFQQTMTAMDAQRKQYEAMAKQIEQKQKALAAHAAKAKAKAKAK